jgi:divalent metal cation (Fe/Co/Zn/Cd) transporter
MRDMDSNTEKARLYRFALALAVFTVVYNIIEGLVSIYFGLTDETLSLLGFGVDSFVEVISGIGIWHMVIRIRRHEGEDPDRFERTALRITATAFYLLAAGLVATAAANLYTGHRPITTFWGNVISLLSISFMWLLIRYKVKVGTALGSQAIIADAHCSRACMQFSIVLLAASLGYQLTGIGYIDSLGALVIGWLAYKEGRESQEKAKGKSCCGCGSSCGTDG